ncbi:MAG: A/G-specific adenine glycosylase [Anaerolineae bacterium]|nr:A/G-specific adenine glycosylase [Anaerolineae bacterium]
MTEQFADDLLAWFDQYAADLPWRRTADSYSIWLAEIMLQQTQVATVTRYYERFLERFPTLADLAAAPLDEVLKLWEGLGYYSRARHLHRAAQMVIDDYGGQMPRTAEALQKLPGVGRYTAGAIASIAFGEAVPAVDGNVIRVLARLYDIPDDAAQPATKNALWARAGALVPARRAGDYNQALMELGRTVCRPHRPACDICPVQPHCRSYAAGTQAERPAKTRRASTPHYDVAAGVIHGTGAHAGRILIAQRPLDGLLGGLWEFPGGKQERGESLPDTLKRELREELAIEVEVGDCLVQVKHAFTHFKITLHAYECMHTGGEPVARGAAAFAWATPDEMDGYAFGKADQAIIKALREKPFRLL